MGDIEIHRETQKMENLSDNSRIETFGVVLHSRPESGYSRKLVDLKRNCDNFLTDF